MLIITLMGTIMGIITCIIGIIIVSIFIVVSIVVSTIASTIMGIIMGIIVSVPSLVRPQSFRNMAMTVMMLRFPPFFYPMAFQQASPQSGEHKVSAYTTSCSSFKPPTHGSRLEDAR